MPISESLRNKVKNYLGLIWLPAILTVLLVIETQLFNSWLNIIPGLYILRRAASNISLGSLIFGLALFFSRKIRYLYLAVVSLLITSIFISQFLYYRYSGGFLPFSALGYAGQTPDLSGTIKTLLTAKLLFFFLPLILVTASYFFSPDRNSTPTKKNNFLSASLIAIIFLGGYGTLLILEKHDWGDISRLYSKVYDVATLEAKMGIVNYYLEDGMKYLSQGQIAKPAEVNFVVNWAAARAPTPLPKDLGLAKGRNVFFIQIESLENWVINAKMGSQEITPNLNQLAKSGEYFNNYYSQIGEGNTADAEFSTLDSLYPLPDSVVFINNAGHQYTGLPATLKARGYTTAVMHGDVPTFWNRSNIYPKLGYEKIFTKSDFKVTRLIGFDGLGDSDFFNQSIPKLQSLPQPFMATLITLSSHTPFEIPKDLQTLNIPADSNLNQTQKDYVQSVHYTDEALGNFFEQLKADNLYNNSIFFIYGDHNAFIGSADSATNHVPFILLAPNTSLQGTNNESSSHLDLYPTVLNLLGIPAPKTIIGQDLFSTTTPVAVQRNVQSGSIKFIISSDLKYTSSGDNVFEHGSCLQLPSGILIAVTNCQTLYQQQSDIIKVSDIVVRYNQIPLLNH